MPTRLCLLMLISAAAWTQTPHVFYFPKPVAPTPYKPPMKPLTRLADLKAKHYGRTDWSELVIDDGNSRAFVISAAPGSKVARHLFPDSPAWWVVQEGRIRFEIQTPQGWQKFEARKGSYVFAPERHLHSLEVVGSEPAIRMEVTLAEATPVFEAAPQGVGRGEIEYIPITLSTGPIPTMFPARTPRATAFISTLRTWSRRTAARAPGASLRSARTAFGGILSTATSATTPNALQDIEATCTPTSRNSGS